MVSRDIRLFDPDRAGSLVAELRITMRRLLAEVCLDFEQQHATATDRYRLPIPFFREVGRAFPLEYFSTWKVVGWIEELNDLLYFVDVEEQLTREKRRRPSADFLAELFEECEEKFYEHAYATDLFPSGQPEGTGFGGRLQRLCRRLAAQVVQESLFLCPGAPSRWLGETPQSSWTVRCEFGAHFERVEQGGVIYVGVYGAHLLPPPLVYRTLVSEGFRAKVVIRPTGAEFVVGHHRVPIPKDAENSSHGWRWVPPQWIRKPNQAGMAGLTLGPTLVYNKSRHPTKVVASAPELLNRVHQALKTLERAWPVGGALVTLLTSHIVPLNAPGVVSLSYRHRPGLSCLNMRDRDQLDLLDDLVHENGHHYFNLWLRKCRLYHKDHNHEIFYSPWRRSLRPLRGIFHGTVTFTMGALLFERLSSWSATGTARAGIGSPNGLTGRHLLRARFRGLEEMASVTYSLEDLTWVGRRLGWVTPSGQVLVKVLTRALNRAKTRLQRFRHLVERSEYGRELRQHERVLHKARTTYRTFWRR